MNNKKPKPKAAPKGYYFEKGRLVKAPKIDLSFEVKKEKQPELEYYV